VNALDIVGQWINTVNEQCGTAFELTPDGACAVEFENGTTLFLQVLPQEESVVLYAPVATLDARPGVLYLLGVLTLNLFNRSTGSGVIGYDAERHSLVYSERVDVGKSSALDFASRLDRFPTVMSRLLEALSDLKTQSGDEGFHPPPMDPRFLKP
jgi:Tir chaperone protein (CesT) family